MSENMNIMNMNNLSLDKDGVRESFNSNHRIGPILDLLRSLRIMQEDVQLPRIVVVGDRSSGKTSVLESIARIRLKTDNRIGTRVPLIMRLQNHPNPESEIFLEYDGRVVSSTEDRVADDIVVATSEIAGEGRGVSNRPLTLIVKKKGVPDLTMVDLPGITYVPFDGQPNDIEEQISRIIMEFITPDESIILNVLRAEKPFNLCESIKLSRLVDKTGQRTLAVVTKADDATESCLHTLIDEPDRIGLSYIWVRNRIGEESHEEARQQEFKLFHTHTHLSKLVKSMVWIPVLIQRLVNIQAAKCLSDNVRKINFRISANLDELNKLPKQVVSISEAMKVLFRILDAAKTLLEGEFDVRLEEMLDQYYEELRSNDIHQTQNNKFLQLELKVLEETRTIGLPELVPSYAFPCLLQRKVLGISKLPFDLVEKVWNYIENLIIDIAMKNSDDYPQQLLSPMRRTAKNLLDKKKQESIDWVTKAIDMEKLSSYTCNPEFLSSWKKFMSHEQSFMSIINNVNGSCSTIWKTDGFGTVDLSHLINNNTNKELVRQAFALKMRMDAYWKIVLIRMVECMAMHLRFSVRNMVKEMDEELMKEMMGDKGIRLERMFEEWTEVYDKRMELEKSIRLLMESKEVATNLMDRIH